MTELPHLTGPVHGERLIEAFLSLAPQMSTAEFFACGELIAAEVEMSQADWANNLVEVQLAPVELPELS